MSIKLNEYEGGKLLEVELRGRQHRADYPRVIPEFERHVQDHGKVRVLVDMRDSLGWDFGEMWEDMKFGAHHLQDIERLAMVGESKWEQWLAQIFRTFTDAPLRYFDRSHKDDALAWLEDETDEDENPRKPPELKLHAIQGVRG